MIKPILKIVLIFLLCQNFLNAQMMEYNHPELEWKTFETENFYVHFHQGTKNSAIKIGKIAEDIHPHLCKTYNYYPKGKIHFIVRDVDDYSNGGAFFFDNKIEIWTSNLDYIMRGSKNWLRDVVTHEYAHMISIQAMIKSNTTVPYAFLQVFGYESEKRKDVVRGFPNTLISYPLSSISLPVWFAEGIAQHQVDSARYDYRDPLREMILRDRVLKNKLLTYNEMTTFGKNSHGNESVYNLGFSFVGWITDRFGEEILAKITANSARWSNYTFEGALEEATGISADSLYLSWKIQLEKKYMKKTKIIRENIQQGEAVERLGSANTYPVFSPDGRKIAWLSNAGEDYFGENRIVVLDRNSGKKEKLTPKVASSLSWSPNGRFLVYARHKRNRYGSFYKDLFLLDVEKDEEHRLTTNMRASNPAYSKDGKKIAFVTETDGLHQLNILTLPETLDGNEPVQLFFDLTNGKMVNGEDNVARYRSATINGGHLEQIKTFTDGRQIYHPRWSPDGKKLVFGTAIAYGRDIAVYDIEDKKFSILLSAKEELRFPVFHPTKPWIYFAGSATGISNIYRYHLKKHTTELLTNVIGGAFMPSVNAENELVYANYDSLGYKIHIVKKPNSIDASLAEYEKNYLLSVPSKNFDDFRIKEPNISPYKQQFTDIHILPRLVIDYETFKPGAYLVSNDVLDKYSLIAGGAVNSRFDYDLYGSFELREFAPTFYAEVFNMNANILDDTLHVVRGKDYTNIYRRDINFNLTEARVGVKNYKLNTSNALLNSISWGAAYIVRRFSAKIKQKSPTDAISGKTSPGFTFRYDYLKGWAAELKMSMNYIGRNIHWDINPNSGGSLFIKYAFESNDFLTGFATSSASIDEVYKNYSYHLLVYDWEQFFENPFLKNHAFSVRLHGGHLDRPVDSYFNFYAGGFVGLKGYSYFSIGGRNSAIATFTYRFPLVNHFDAILGHIYFDKLYLGLFYDYGNAWDDKLNFADFKQDAGIQLRLSTFSYSIFPTKLFAEAAYPLNEVSYEDIHYPKEWRFYFGALFEFDLRERMGSLIHHLSHKQILR
jgi:Tol biopolymer transport system component